MKKIVEIEYVGIEDIQEITDDAYALMRLGHYVNVEMLNLRHDDVAMVNVAIRLGGWDATGSNDYSFRFYMTDNSEDVKIMNECKNSIKNLLPRG